jgi:hypothetical protein
MVFIVQEFCKSPPGLGILMSIDGLLVDLVLVGKGRVNDGTVVKFN